MSFAPFFSAPVIVQIHILAALVALLLGPLVILRRSRDVLHKAGGYLWVAAMVVLATSSLQITAVVGPRLYGYGVIHILAFVVFVSLWQAIRAARAGQIQRHRMLMTSLFTQALGIAGLFTLLPGRRMNAILFPQTPVLGWVVIVMGGAAIAWLSWRNSRLPYRST
ncbi:MAG: DUF2306 domain-containing protein [Pseudomonadota bacterium]